MKTIAFTITGMALTITLLAGCGSPPVEHRSPRSMALIMSGDVVSYNAHVFGTSISVVDVDGKPVKEPYGPVELSPGRHVVTLACDGNNTARTLTVAAGEVYQFMARATPGARKCVGSLSRVRSTNP